MLHCPLLNSALENGRDNLIAIALYIVFGQNFRTMTAIYSTKHQTNFDQEDMGDYVAQLQLHMALQAKNLVPSLEQARDSRHQLLHDTQIHLEKMASRQVA